MAFKHRVAAARLAAGLTVKEAARLAGVTLACWYHWENGRRTPSVKAARRIAQILNVSLGWLLGDNDERRWYRESPRAHVRCNMASPS